MATASSVLKKPIAPPFHSAEENEALPIAPNLPPFSVSLPCEAPLAVRKSSVPF